MTEIVIQVDGQDYVIHSAEDVESWANGLGEIISDIAEENGFYAYEPLSDIGSATEREIAGAVELAMKEYRTDDTLNWEDVLNDALKDALDSKGFIFQHEDWAIQIRDFNLLIENIEDCLSDHEDLNIDLDEIKSELLSELIIKLEGNDSSRPVDCVKNLSIRFVYVPDYGVVSDSLDSFQMNTNRVHLSEPEGVFSLCKLFEVRPISLISHLPIDQDETEVIDKWIQLESDFGSFDYQSENANKVAYIIENTGIDYGIPMWIGKIKMSDILSLDPRKEIRLKGGQAGIHNNISGAGFIDSHPDDQGIILAANQVLKAESGYGEESVYGISGHFLKASASNLLPTPIKRAKQLHENMSHSPDC